MYFLGEKLVFSMKVFMLLGEINENSWRKKLKSHQEFNNKIRTTDVYMAIIYIKVMIKILKVIEIGRGEKTEREE